MAKQMRVYDGSQWIDIASSTTDLTAYATKTGAESLTNKKLGSLTTNGLVTTSGGDGTLSVTTMGSGISTFISTPSSNNLLSAITDETGSGSLVFATSPVITPAAPSGTTSGTVTTSASTAGYLGMPINAQGSAGVALSYTLVASDAGKTIYISSTPTTPTITIPANGSVAYETGTTIVIMNDIGAATNVSIAITTDTLQLAGLGSTGTRTLARYGVATIVKVTPTKWIISGTGVS